MADLKLQSDHILSFLQELNPEFHLPAGVSIMNPYAGPDDFYFAKQFYSKFYSDRNTRSFIIGINPGRLGGGITGIPFTDPLKLEKYCGIPNGYQKKTELSADFIYKMISAGGGVQQFYSTYFFTAVCPLGFVKDGKNMNYYDDRKLQANAEQFIVDCMKKQLTTIAHQPVAFCLGEGSNFKYLSQLNNKHSFFENIVPLPHPRWIMQYRRKYLDKYIDLYINNLKSEPA